MKIDRIYSMFKTNDEALDDKLKTPSYSKILLILEHQFVTIKSQKISAKLIISLTKLSRTHVFYTLTDMAEHHLIDFCEDGKNAGRYKFAFPKFDEKGNNMLTKHKAKAEAIVFKEEESKEGD